MKPLLYVIPSGLPLAIPMGLALGIVCGTAKRVSRAPSLNLIVLLTIVCTAAVFADLLWIVPDANQAYRLSTWGPDALRGANELTFRELRSLIWGLGQYGPRGPLEAPHDMRTLAFSYYTRWALLWATPFFAFFTFSMTGGRFWRAVAASAAFLAYYELLYGGRHFVIVGTLPAGFAAWLPNAVLATVAFASIVFHRFTGDPHTSIQSM